MNGQVFLEIMVFALHTEGWVGISQVEADGRGGEDTQ